MTPNNTADRLLKKIEDEKKSPRLARFSLNKFFPVLLLLQLVRAQVE